MKEKFEEDRIKEFEALFVGDNYKYGIGYLAWKEIKPFLKITFAKIEEDERQRLLKEIKDKLPKERDVDYDEGEFTACRAEGFNECRESVLFLITNLEK